ncbi:hypothetical protein Tco_1285209 [Tanacetum coccineum]
MLASMSPYLQKTLEIYKAYDMIQELKTMFEEQAKHELFEMVKAFHACKQEDGQSHGEDDSLATCYAQATYKGIPKKAATPVVLAIKGDPTTTKERKSVKGLDLPSLQGGGSLEE